jgi:hypothetical protein
MSPKQIVMLVVSIIVIIGSGIWIYKEYRKWNPKPQPMDPSQMYQQQYPYQQQPPAEEGQ